MTHLRGLLDVTRLVNEASDLSELLEAVARTIADSLGFGTVAVNLYRPAFDDFIVTTVQGSEAARSALLNTTNPAEAWQPLLDDRFVRRDAYVIRAGQVDWDALELPRYVPQPSSSFAASSDAWSPEDSLMVPLRSSTGEMLGILSVDEPAGGRVPSDEELDVLVALARHAALAMEQAQRRTAAERHRNALVRLLEVSGKLARASSSQEVLESVCSAISSTLGFQKVAINLLDGDGLFHVRAAHGWELSDRAVSAAYAFDEVAELFDPIFELEGTYLIPHEQAIRRVARKRQTYASKCNGRGPHAWNRHWLMVPLTDGDGGVIGIVWADDPEDLLLPSLERRQALRMFADQAALSLYNTAQRENLRASQERFKHQAMHDPLTGLGNTALFTSALERALHRSTETHQVAVLFVDLDDFKSVNDSMGHEAGDHFLAETARRLSDCLRPTDTAARVGGDEFAVMLESCTLGAAESVAARVHRMLRTPIVLGNSQLQASASVGIAMGTSGIDTPKSLMSRADAAMYAAKAQGKSRSVTFGTTEHLAVVERQQLKAQASDALHRGEFHVHYQPIVDVASGALTGFEALVRWQHPERGMLLPETFIPLMEESGAIVALGDWVLEEACRSLGVWRRRYPSLADLHVNVNLSARQLLGKHLVDHIEDVLERHDVAASSLVLEFTESVLLEDDGDTIERLNRLRVLGVRLAIDDFGTGYSSLAYLRNFPIDVLKIEKQFVQGASEAVEDAALAQAIVYLGKSLGLQTVAEGIETRRHLEAIAALKCDEGQGFFFGDPVPHGEFEERFLAQAAQDDELAAAGAEIVG